jgi:hypothetical protein
MLENWNNGGDQSCQKTKPFNYEIREMREFILQAMSKCAGWIKELAKNSVATIDRPW